jgi:ceramide glucosyltransferase
MTFGELVFLGAVFWWGAISAIHLATVACAWVHPRFRTARALNSERPALSVVVPLMGLEPELEQNLRALFAQDYPDYEVLFSVAERDDPAAALAEQVMAETPEVPARLLAGRVTLSSNPKTNNMINALKAARHDTILATDCNVRSEPGRFTELVRHLGGRQGLVSATAVGADPDTVAGELECAFLNGYGARFLLSGDIVGFTSALGKTLLFRMSDLERAGGIERFARGMADDTALTEALGDVGLRVVMSESAAVHPVSGRRFGEFWKRHTRWLVYRRDYAPLAFVLEPLGGGLGSTWNAYLFGYFGLFGLSEPVYIAANLVFWYGLEAALVRARRWHLGWASPFAWMVRDIVLPAMWLQSLLSRRMGWKGGTVTAAPAKPKGETR